MLASVGVLDGMAWSPTDGATLFLRTTRLPSAWTFSPPTGSAMYQYLPGVGIEMCAT